MVVDGLEFRRIEEAVGLQPGEGQEVADFMGTDPDVQAHPSGY